MKIIEFRNLSKHYTGDIKAVNEVSLVINENEFVSLVGQSGAGKTTLVRLLIAEERPSAGRILVGDWDTTNIKPAEIPILRKQIGVVFQDFKLLDKKTVFENVAFALETAGMDNSKIKSVVPQLLKIVNLEDKGKRFPWELSGGEKQRTAIARALAHRPKILVADEPTGNLDSINSKDIINLLLKINEFGTTVILVTHNKEIVNSIKKRVVTMDKGEVISDQARGRYLI